MRDDDYNRIFGTQEPVTPTPIVVMVVIILGIFLISSLVMNGVL